MNPKFKKFLNVVLLILVGILLIRIFPLVFRLVEGMAMEIGRFWWVVLILVVVGFVFFVMKKQK